MEFGAKLSVSVVNGFVFAEKLEWDAYNENGTLIDSLKRYRTRDNRDFCKSRGIRLSGPKLGRSSEEEKKEAKTQAYQDSCERNEVEGKFGTGKRKYALDCIMAKLQETSESVIILNLLVMNLDKRFRLLLCNFLRRLEFYIYMEFCGV